VLNPATSLSTLDWVLEGLDVVMLMSVNPGFGGQTFIPATLEKVRALREIIGEKGLTTLIEVDGGINANTIAEASRAGVDVFVAGSAVFGSDDYGAVIRRFRELVGDEEGPAS
jgi:ribulose-phosphate 3-epimerase